MATMNPAGAVNTGLPASAIGRCQVCGNMRATALAKFDRNIGMIILRQVRSIQGNMCKTCLSKKFWEFTGLNLLLGPWGVISLIMTPIFLITNTVSYVSASRKLRDAVE